MRATLYLVTASDGGKGAAGGKDEGRNDERNDHSRNRNNEEDEDENEDWGRMYHTLEVCGPGAAGAGAGAGAGSPLALMKMKTSIIAMDLATPRLNLHPSQLLLLLEH